MLDQQLIVGSNYRLKFKGAFERHGVCTTSGLSCIHEGNGVFRLEQISSFRDIVMAGVKLYDNFFAPVGVSEDEYKAYFSDKPDDEFAPEYTTKIVYDETERQELVKDASATSGISVKKVKTVTGHEVFVESGKSLIRKHAQDKVNYANYPIYKFVDVIDSTDAIYVPELTIDGFPEIEINEYKDLHLCFHLGLFDKPALLDPMLLAIRERMAVYGIKPKHIKLYSTGSKWLNPDEYEALKSLRVPGDIDTIPANAEFEDYRGDHIIIGGQIKEIVQTPDRVDEQVAFDELKSGPAVLDNRLFLQPVLPGDTFNSSKVYYEQLVDADNKEVGWHVMNGVGECPPQEEIMQFVELPLTWTLVQGKRPEEDKNRYYTKGVYAEMTSLDEYFQDKYTDVTGGETDAQYYRKDDNVYTKLTKVASASDKYVKVEGDAKNRRFDAITEYYYKDTSGNYIKLSSVSPSIADEDLGTYEYKATITFINSKTYDVYYKTQDIGTNQYIAGTTRFRDKPYIVYQLFSEKYTYAGPNAGLPQILPANTYYTCSADNVPNKYMAVDGDYVLLAYGEARSNSSATNDGYMRELTATNLTRDQIAKDPDKYFWIKTTKRVDGGKEEIVWKTATSLEAGDPSWPIYRKMITTYTVGVPGLSNQTIYISKPRYNPNSTDPLLPGPLGPVKGSGQFKYEDYVAEPSLKLIGTTFEYLNEYGHKKTNVLDLVDIIEFCGRSKDVTMFWEDPSSGKHTDAMDRLWAQYNGRKFQYELGIKDDTGKVIQSVWVEVTISNAMKSVLAGITGKVIGQDGTISRSLYFTKDTTLKRNYYLQYTVLKHQFDVLQDKYNKLEKHVLAVANVNRES